MEPEYQIGQKVIVKRFETKLPSAGDADIGQYESQSGTVTNYYGISPNRGEVFFIYTVKVGANQKEIVLHEDEMKLDKAKVHLLDKVEAISNIGTGLNIAHSQNYGKGGS